MGPYDSLRYRLTVTGTKAATNAPLINVWSWWSTSSDSSSNVDPPVQGEMVWDMARTGKNAFKQLQSRNSPSCRPTLIFVCSLTLCWSSEDLDGVRNDGRWLEISYKVSSMIYQSLSQPDRTSCAICVFFLSLANYDKGDPFTCPFGFPPSTLS